MKFANILYKDKETVCAVDTENGTFTPIGDGTFPNLQLLIECWDDLKDVIMRQLEDPAVSKKISLEEGEYLAPIKWPKRNVVCLGKNYLEHIKEIKGVTGGPKDSAPEHPIYFTKAAYPCNHHKGIILRHPTLTDQIDYEVELAVIIGKRGTDIPVEEALDYVFGYSIGNDISCRDVQKRSVNWFRGKSLISHCPIGPYIVLKDEIPDPQNLDIKSYVNGELRQNGNTSNMIWGVAEIIADLSQGYELFPGDIILTGTPKGVGMGFEPPKFLKAGDEIRCYVEGIGELVNYVED